MRFLFLLLLPSLLIRNITFEECKQKWVAKNHVMIKPLKLNVLFLTTLPTLKACNSPYMQLYFKWFFVLHSLEVICSFLLKKSKQKAIEIETEFFHSLGNLKDLTLDHFFYASHIRHNVPYKLIRISVS